MTKHIPWLALLAAAWPAWGDTLYKCQSPDGKTTYTNQKEGNKNCDIISQDKPVSIGTAPPKAKPQGTPADFPRVNGEQQKARDSDRRSILEKELANEQKLLDNAKKELVEQENLVLPEERAAGGGIQAAKREARIQSYRDRIQLHQRNLESLRKELSNLK